MAGSANKILTNYAKKENMYVVQVPEMVKSHGCTKKKSDVVILPFSKILEEFGEEFDISSIKTHTFCHLMRALKPLT